MQNFFFIPIEIDIDRMDRRRIHNGSIGVDNTEHRGILPVVNNMQDKFVKQSGYYPGLLIAVTSWWTVGGQDDKERGNNADAINLRQYRRVLPRLPPRWANERREGKRGEREGRRHWRKENETEGSLRVQRLRLWRGELVKFDAGRWYGYFAMDKSLWTRLWRIVSKNVRKCVSSW